MDPEIAKFVAHLDQSRSQLRDALFEMDRDSLVNLFHLCVRGQLAKMDERAALLTGLLAAMTIYDLRLGGGLADLDESDDE